MKTYRTYAYSIPGAIIGFIVYLFIGMALLGFQLESYPALRLRYFSLEFLGTLFISWLLSQLTAKRRLSVEIGNNFLVIKRNGAAFGSRAERVINFNDIKNYKQVIHSIRSSIFLIELHSDSRVKLYEKWLPWLHEVDFSLMVSDFGADFEASKHSSVQPINGRHLFPDEDATAAASVDINNGVVSHRKVGLFILISIVSLFYLGYFGLMLTAIFLEEHSILFLCFSLLGYFMFFFNYYRYFQNVPKIRLDKAKITFGGKEVYYWDDVEAVQFSGKQPFKYLGSTPMEGAMVHFKNGKVRYIFDSFYKNAWQLKSFMREVMKTKEEYAQWVSNEIENVGVPSEKKPVAVQQKYPDIFIDPKLQSFQYYKGPQFASFQAYLLWPGLCADVWGMIAVDDADIAVFLGIVGVLWFLLLSLGMNYFGVSEDFLIVKNQNLFWRKKLYRLKDIQEIRLDSPGNGGNVLNVIFTDFKEKAYRGPSLRNNDWYALKTDLEHKGIKVKDENYFTEMQRPGMKKAYKLMVLYAVGYVVVVLTVGLLISFSNLQPVPKRILNIVWVVVMLAGVLGVRRVIVKLGAMADRIDNKGKTD